MEENKPYKYKTANQSYYRLSNRNSNLMTRTDVPLFVNCCGESVIREEFFRQFPERRDYELIYKQTGLTRLGVDPLLEEKNIGEILRIQDAFFSERDYYYDCFAPFTGRFEKKRGRYPNAPLCDGDIIFCPATYLSSSVLGHTAIVVDGEVGRIAEAYGFGAGFDTTLSASFFVYPAFVILRPKVDEQIKQQVAQYTKTELVGAEYDILAGLFEEKAPEVLERTHCSHAVWYAYNKFGIDLDSNGGKIVTPTDILNSPYLEVVQVFGMDIDDFR